MEEIGEYDKSNRIFHQALHADSLMYGQWHELVATDMYYLALTYFHLAKYAEAKNYGKLCETRSLGLACFFVFLVNSFSK